MTDQPRILDALDLSTATWRDQVAALRAVPLHAIGRRPSHADGIWKAECACGDNFSGKTKARVAHKLADHIEAGNIEAGTDTVPAPAPAVGEHGTRVGAALDIAIPLDVIELTDRDGDRCEVEEPRVSGYDDRRWTRHSQATGLPYHGLPDEEITDFAPLTVTKVRA